MDIVSDTLSVLRVGVDIGRKKGNGMGEQKTSDCISRQAAIDALHMNLMYRMGTDSNKKRLDEWINALPSAQPDLDSAYTEGYTAAESKYRKMWDEMQANIKAKAFGKRKGLIHTAVDTVQ